MASQTLVVALAIASTFAAGVIAASLWSALRRVRTRAERMRRTSDDVRQALALLGEALASTHDSQALLAVILEATVTATQAAGGTVSREGVPVAAVGDTRGAPELVLPLGDGRSEASLALHAQRGGFRPETHQLARSMATQGRIALENARLHRAAAEQAVTDELTRLANRRRFAEALETELHRAERFGTPLGVLLCDLDDFKQINDEYGHAAGDVVLRRVADVIRSCLRDIDLPARIGGEEFAVLVPEADADGASRVAERIRSALRATPVTLGGEASVSVTASFGVASFPDARTSDALLRAADAALYAAKRRGKDRTVAAAE